MHTITDAQLAAIRAVCDDALGLEQSRECPDCGGRGWQVKQNLRDDFDRIDCPECGGAGKLPLYEAFEDDLRELADNIQTLIDKCVALRTAFTRPFRSAG